MAIELVESLDLKEYKVENLFGDKNDDSLESISEKSIMLEYEAVHEVVTRNFTLYTKNAMKSSEQSWTYPYKKPIIMHHKDEDGKIIGRVCSATTIDTSNAGVPCLKLTGNISDPEGVEAVLDGRLKTTSIGVSVQELHCSICGADLTLENPYEHRHVRGEEYDGEVCYWIIDKMEAKELSYVIVPSDRFSQHTKVYRPKKKEIEKGESFEMANIELKEQATEVDAKEKEVVVTETADRDKMLEEVTQKLEVLTQAFEDFKNKYAELQEVNTALKTEKKDLEIKKEEAEKELKDVKAENDTLADEVVATKESVEALRNEILELKEGKERNNIVEEILSLREQLNKRPIEKDALISKSVDYLKESVEDLKYELSLKENIDEEIASKETKQIKNPCIVSKGDNISDKGIETKEAEQKNDYEKAKEIASRFLASKF